MERLTNGINYCQLHCDFGKEKDCLFQDKTKCYEKNMYEKLRSYEEAEDQGLLLRLPCKEGSTVYVIKSRYTECTRENQEFDEYNCQGCEWLDCDSHKEYYIHTNKSVTLEWIVRYLKDIGKTVFLSTEEAEQALKRMESE